MTRHRFTAVTAAAVVALALAASALSSGSGLSMGPNKWDDIQTGVTYRLYQPSKNLGQKQNALKTVSCGKGHDVWVAATYGSYKGVLNSKTKGFGLYEGHPICANAGTSSKIKAPKIKGAKGKVYAGVYCDAPKKCKAKQGVKNGFTVQWTMKSSKPYHKTTQMQVDSAHMRWSQVVKFIRGLKPVG